MMSPLVLLLLVGAAFGSPATFEGEQVYRIVPKTQGQLEFLIDLHENDADLDFWLFPSRVNRPVDIHLTVEQVPRYLGKFQSEGIQAELTIPDISELIAAENFTPDNVWSDWQQFETFEEIEGFLAGLADAYEFVTLESIGQSTEGRNIWLLRINKNPSDSKKSAFMESNLHAREWITSSSMTWIINELLTTDDPLLDEWDLHITPMLNPDGYVWSQESYRMWRKTRSINQGSVCIGTDPNRNYDKSWSGPGTSFNPCSDIYHGSEPFSEPETAAAAAYIGANDFDFYLSFHSYSQYILLPWADSTEEPEDYDELMRVGTISMNAIVEAGQGDGVWETDTAPNLLYIACGASMDWAKGVAGIDYSYTYELRDRGRYGFILPADQIIPAAIETYAGVRAFLEEL